MIWLALYLAFAVVNAFWLRHRFGWAQRLNDCNWQAWVLADIIHRAGLPDGTFQLLMGPGAVVGSGLAGHRGVDAITAGRKATEHMLPLLHSLLE